MTAGNFSGGEEERCHLSHGLSGDNETTEQGGVGVGLTSHGTEGEAVHAGLVVSALEVQRQPEGLAPSHHQVLPAQVSRVVVTAIGLQLQVTSLQNKICGDRS